MRLEEEDFAMIPHFSQSIVNDDGSYMESGVTKYMTGSHEFSKTLAEWNSKLHMVLGDKS